MTKEERFDAFIEELKELTAAEKCCTDYPPYVDNMDTWVKFGGERPHKPNP